MVTTHLDTPSVERLRTVVGVKWSKYPDCIGAWVAEMDFATAPVIQDTLRKVVDEGFFGYRRDSDVLSMQEAVSNWYEREYNWSIPVERVRPMPDVLAGLAAAMTVTPPGAKVIVPTPAYMPFLIFPKLYRREHVEVPMLNDNGSWAYDYDAIDAAFASSPKGSLLVLCNPCNPIGRVFRSEELESIQSIVDRHGGRVFSDEIHAPIVYPGNHHIPYASISEVSAGHTITAVSASKAWNLAGLKCAQLLLSNEADEQHWTDVGLVTEHGTSTIGVIANIAAFAEGKPWLNEVMTYLDQNRLLLGDLLERHLPRVRYTPPEGTYLAWLDFSAYDLPDDLACYFRDEAKVAIVDGSACGEDGCGFVRLNIAMSNQLLEQSIEQMAAAVNAYASA